MFVTNCKIIIGPDIPEKDMKAIMKRLGDKAKKEIETVTGVAFPLVKEPYLHFENKFNIPFPDLRELFRGDDSEIVFRAIGDENVQVPGFSYKLTQIALTPEIKEEIATAMCQTQEKKESVEIEKTEHAKACKAQLDALEKAMDELVTRYRRGYDEKEIKCVVQFDFANKVKNYLMEDTGDVIASEDLQPSDYQMKIDYIPGVPIPSLTEKSNPEEVDLPFGNADDDPGDDLPM